MRRQERVKFAGSREYVMARAGHSWWGSGNGRGWWRGAAALALLVVAVVGLAGCDLFGGGSTSASASNDVALAQLAWCDAPLISFQDNGTTARNTLTNWTDVKGQLGFTPYLPPTLPKGSCLVLAGGTIHDPIYGGHLSITYDVPSTGPISFSEAPKRANLGDKLQCTASAQDAKTTICLGTIADTSITVASRQSAADLQALFKTLKADVAWVPSNTDKLLATPTATDTPAAAPAATTTATGA